MILTDMFEPTVYMDRAGSSRTIRGYTLLYKLSAMIDKRNN